MEDKQLSPKMVRKERDILKFALEVFAREGFHNADVQVIADLAGVGKGTIYRYFGNKEQLFLATSRRYVEHLGEHVDKQLGILPEEYLTGKRFDLPDLLRRIARACAEYYQKNPYAIEIIIQERAEFRESVYPTHLMFRSESHDRFSLLIEQAMDRGELRKANSQNAAHAYSDLLFGSLINGCLEGKKSSLVERVETAVGFFLDGIVAPEYSARKR
ncbi:MAG: TetR family transcriptional regulator [Planctomyces sp.]|nr:TetR family transcriptional regulator [Planctomyces sp.]